MLILPYGVKERNELGASPQLKRWNAGILALMKYEKRIHGLRKMGFRLRVEELADRRGCRSAGSMAIIILAIKLKMDNIL